MLNQRKTEIFIWGSFPFVSMEIMERQPRTRKVYRRYEELYLLIQMSFASAETIENLRWYFKFCNESYHYVHSLKEFCHYSHNLQES